MQQLDCGAASAFQLQLGPVVALKLGPGKVQHFVLRHLLKRSMGWTVNPGSLHRGALNTTCAAKLWSMGTCCLSSLYGLSFGFPMLKAGCIKSGSSDGATCGMSGSSFGCIYLGTLPPSGAPIEGDRLSTAAGKCRVRPSSSHARTDE